MQPEQAEMDESVSDIAFRWGVIAVIVVVIGVLTYLVFAGDEDLGTATTQVAPQYLQSQPASN